MHCELVTSQHHWFSGSPLDISKFSNVNNFLVYSPICIKFVPKSLVLEILSFWLGFTVSNPFPLMVSLRMCSTMDLELTKNAPIKVEYANV